METAALQSLQEGITMRLMKGHQYSNPIGNWEEGLMNIWNSDLPNDVIDWTMMFAENRNMAMST